MNVLSVAIAKPTEGSVLERKLLAAEASADLYCSNRILLECTESVGEKTMKNTSRLAKRDARQAWLVQRWVSSTRS